MMGVAAVLLCVAGLVVMAYGLAKVCSMPPYRCSVCQELIADGEEMGRDQAGGGFLCASCARGRRSLFEWWK